MRQTPDPVAHEARDEIARLRAHNAALLEQTRQLSAANDHLTLLLGSAPDSVLGVDRNSVATDWSSERKQTLDLLRQSEDKYRAVVEHVGQGMVVLQGDQLRFANTRAAEIVEMPLQELLAVNFLHRIHPDDHAIVRERRRRRLAGEAVPSRYEVRLLMPDGRVRWIELGVTLLPWEGEPATLTFFSDVTERKELENQLARGLEERETILENSMVGIAFLTAQGQAHWANTTMRHIFGAPQGTEIPTSTEALYPSREAFLATRAQVGACLARGEVFEAELQMRRLDGRLFWASVSCKAVDPHDASPATVWVIMDITRRKELEETLQKTSSEREAILNNALVGIVLSVARTHQWVNARFAEMMGYSRDELIGASTSITHLNDAQWLATGVQARAALLSTGTYAAERQLRRRNGELLWVQLAGQCVRGHDPDAGVIWTFLDISTRRQAEEDTRAALARQQELNELRSRFVAMTSHEFRTPLATILSSSELLRYYGDRMPEPDKLEMLQTIEGAVQRMTRMLDRMLHMGKTEAQMLEFHPTDIDLPALCQLLAEEACTQHGAAASRVLTHFAANLPSGRFDEKLLRHIFGNLLSNAIKYSPDGSTVQFNVWAQAGQTVFEVADQGIGIPDAEVPHLFESFHRASNVGDIQGTGLGLAIVKSSVERHGGRIAVDSRVGGGSRFQVHLPST